MSEVKETTETKKARKPYEVLIDNESFNPDYDGKYMTSIEFCKLTAEIFGSLFANWYGCKFEVSGGNPAINLFFTHASDFYDKKKDEDGNDYFADKNTGEVVHLATERFNGNTVGSTIIDKTRGRDNLMTNGDRYHITQDGIDIIKPLLFPRLYNNGNVNWKNIVTEIADRNGSSVYGTMNVTQLTKVIGVDPRRIASLIWGRKDEDGPIDYGISVMRDLSINSGYGMPGQGNNYALNITRAHTETLTKTYEKMGLGGIGSNIIR